MVTVPATAMAPFDRFTRYNSPYPAHDAGRAVDLYPGEDIAPSPVAGTVASTRTVACPSRPYAADSDHPIVVDTGNHLARVLHVDPAVEPGERVALGDPLGRLVRSGYFAPWVDNHVHLGFRDHGANAVRATGSLPLRIDVALEPVPWDGTGTVVATGDTYAILDAPDHPDPGNVYAGIGDDSGRYVLDGGLPHYEWGGRLAPGVGDRPESVEDERVSVLGAPVGTARGESVRWDDVTVLANGTPVHGLSFFVGREELYAKIIAREHALAIGESVTVTVDV